MKKAVGILLVSCAALAVIWFVSNPSNDQGQVAAIVKQDTPAQKVEKAVAYLKDVPEIAEYRIEHGNHIWIALKGELPEDADMIVRGVALNAHEAYGAGAHAYLIKGIDSLEKIPHVPVYCSATARYGKIENANCGSEAK